MREMIANCEIQLVTINGTVLVAQQRHDITWVINQNLYWLPREVALRFALKWAMQGIYVARKHKDFPFSDPADGYFLFKGTKPQ